MRPIELIKQRVDDLTQPGIYLIYSIASEKGYIGSTIQSFKRRFYNHRSDIRIGRHCNEHLVKAWNLYGKDNFLFVPIEIFKGTREELIERENFYIRECLKSDPECLYNLTEAYLRPPTGGMTGKHHSEESKQKIANANSGRIVCEEFRSKMSQIVKGRKWSKESREAFKKPKSEEAKKKMSISKTGRKLSEETRKKMSEAQKKRYS